MAEAKTEERVEKVDKAGGNGNGGRWRIGGAGLVAALLSPFFFFALNYLAYLVGHDPQPARKAKKTT